jgi:o-succinylbenzoate synthase
MSMRLEWRRLRLPLALPLRIGGRSLAERRVLDLRLTGDGSRRGRGEAAPLPGLHAETLDELPDRLPQALRRLQEAVDTDPAKLAGPTAYLRLLTRLHAAPDWCALPPSLRCGLEGALLGWLAEGGDPARRLGLPAGEAPPAAALFDGNLEQLLQALEGPLAGTRCIKLKVGRRGLASEVELLQGLRAVAGEDLEIRLDANRAFSLPEALEFAAAVRPLRPVWIEEPLRSPLALPDFIEKSGLSVALDETLCEPDHAHAGHGEGVAAWVLKPARLGLMETLGQFRRAAAAPGRPACVVSSCFEGFTGLSLLGTLARCAPGLPAPGLGTIRWFSGLEDPIDSWSPVRA